MDDDKFLKQRGEQYYYYCRVPKRLRPFYPGEFIRIALGTSSLAVARARRDELVGADEIYWGKLRLSLDLERMGEPMDIEHARKRYEGAKARALAAGFRFRAMDELAAPGMIEEVLSRLQAIERRAPSNGALYEEDVAAMLGVTQPPDPGRLFGGSVRLLNLTPFLDHLTCPFSALFASAPLYRLYRRSRNSQSILDASPTSSLALQGRPPRSCPGCQISRSAGVHRRSAMVDLTIGAIAALGVAVYLGYTLIFPDKF